MPVSRTDLIKQIEINRKQLSLFTTETDNPKNSENIQAACLKQIEIVEVRIDSLQSALEFLSSFEKSRGALEALHTALKKSIALGDKHAVEENARVLSYIKMLSMIYFAGTTVTKSKPTRGQRIPTRQHHGLTTLDTLAASSSSPQIFQYPPCAERHNSRCDPNAPNNIKEKTN